MDWLVQLDPMSYQDKVVYEKGVKVIYLLVEKAIYGMLVASLIWYRKLRKDLEQIGFTFNVYDSCVANHYQGKDQQTLRLHVDNMLVSCKNKKSNDEFVTWCQEKYGQYKKVKCNRGKIHTFLGMVLDFERDPGSVHVLQEEHVSNLIKTFPEELKGKALTPAAADLFERGPGGLLGKA